MARPGAALMAVLLLAGCAAAGSGPGTALEPGPEAVSPPPASGPSHTPEEIEILDTLLEGLHLSFSDPVDASIRKLVGPYTFVRGEAGTLDFVGFDDHGDPAPVTLLLREDAIWVRTELSGREYLTRID